MLPPLSEWDDAWLCVLLPLLAAVLAGRNYFKPLSSPAALLSEGEGYVAAPPSWSGDAAPYLLNYTMEIEWDASSRSAVALCFFSAVLCCSSARGGDEGEAEKMVEGAFEEKMSPAFAGTVSELPRIHKEGEDDVA